MVLAGFVGDFGWFWMVLGGFRSFWVVPCFSNYGNTRLPDKPTQYCENLVRKLATRFVMISIQCLVCRAIV